MSSGGLRSLLVAVQSRLLVGGWEEGQKDEGLEPGHVGVEPVVGSELEADDQRRREGGEPAHRAAARPDGDYEGKEYDGGQERLLQKAERRDLAEDRPRGLPGSLEGYGLLVEEPG